MNSSRGRLRGTVQILKFNWSFYVAGFFAVAAGVAVLHFFRLPAFLYWLGALGVGLAAWWWFASILASWWIYDHSPLMSWTWVSELVAPCYQRWANLHSGLDESTIGLSEVYGEPHDVVDFFDEKEMTEPSILRARRLAVNEVKPRAASFEALPFEDGSLELMTVTFAAHEIRDEARRTRFFGEMARCLSPGGRLVVVEHQRDFANFMVFGPGFMHFFPTSSWRRMGQGAGLESVYEIRMTPFVKAFVWGKP